MGIVYSLDIFLMYSRAIISDFASHKYACINLRFLIISEVHPRTVDLSCTEHSKPWNEDVAIWGEIDVLFYLISFKSASLC